MIINSKFLWIDLWQYKINDDFYIISTFINNLIIKFDDENFVFKK